MMLNTAELNDAAEAEFEIQQERERQAKEWADLRRRIGTFTIQQNLLPIMDKRIWSALFSNMIVVRCESIYYSDTLEYTAISPDFEPVVLGQDAKRYRPVITMSDGRITSIKFERVA